MSRKELFESFTKDELSDIYSEVNLAVQITQMIAASGKSLDDVVHDTSIQHNTLVKIITGEIGVTVSDLMKIAKSCGHTCKIGIESESNDAKPS